MQHRRIIKRGPVVVATNEDGSMDPSSSASQGLFLADTRYLSTFHVCIGGQAPVLLGSSEEILFQASYLHTNAELGDIPARAIGLLQRNSIADDAVQIELSLVNWSLHSIQFEFEVTVGSDFFDSFEARGVKRLKRGETLPVQFTNNHIELQYLGLDQVTRKTRVEVKPDMASFEDGRMLFDIRLERGQRLPIMLEIYLVEEAPEGVSLQPQPHVARTPKPDWFDACTVITTSNATFEAIITRSIDDIEVLLTEFEDAWVPAAGLPRFAVPFGRDSLITGLETLIWNHQIARNVLRFLAARQGKVVNPWNYEQPGKIMHEMHTGELARLKEVPFGLFYGSVDSTVLFLVLAGEYVRWTSDLSLYHELKPNLDAAWEWIERYGDIDGSGYVQYQAHTPPKASSAALTVGLFNQGWKDSSTAVMYADGTMVTDHPVSLAEVQGDLYRALYLWAELYAAMPASEGMANEGHRLAGRAADLKVRFNRDFWMPGKNYYAMALDGHHRQVDSITSNPAECLWARLIDEEHAAAMIETLMSDRLFTSWGVRTMSNTEPAYNPFSYHNGSIWPFENALIASGLKKYGYVVETQAVLDSLLDASLSFEYRRWPEVYAGVSREVGGVLARQPDASRPQAWSAGAIFSLLQTILGAAPAPFSKRIDITPALPSCLNEIVIRNLRMGGSQLSLRLVRDGTSILMEIVDNPDEFDVVIHPAGANHHAVSGGDMPATSG
ncbi:MAG TPA: glycogen debranching N-terminal domain-containing protein [Chloroflexota bacterium]